MMSDAVDVLNQVIADLQAKLDKVTGERDDAERRCEVWRKRHDSCADEIDKFHAVLHACEAELALLRKVEEAGDMAIRERTCSNYEHTQENCIKAGIDKEDYCSRCLLLKALDALRAAREKGE